jgi:hypothetical protein
MKTADGESRRRENQEGGDSMKNLLLLGILVLGMTFTTGCANNLAPMAPTASTVPAEEPVCP